MNNLDDKVEQRRWFKDSVDGELVCFPSRQFIRGSIWLEPTAFTLQRCEMEKEWDELSEPAALSYLREKGWPLPPGMETDEKKPAEAVAPEPQPAPRPMRHWIDNRHDCYWRERADGRVEYVGTSGFTQPIYTISQMEDWTKPHIEGHRECIQAEAEAWIRSKEAPSGETTTEQKFRIKKDKINVNPVFRVDYKVDWPEITYNVLEQSGAQEPGKEVGKMKNLVLPYSSEIVCPACGTKDDYFWGSWLYDEEKGPFKDMRLLKRRNLLYRECKKCGNGIFMHRKDHDSSQIELPPIMVRLKDWTKAKVRFLAYKTLKWSILASSAGTALTYYIYNDRLGIETSVPEAFGLFCQYAGNTFGQMV